MKQLLTLIIFLLFTMTASAQSVVTAPGSFNDLVYVPGRDALYAVRPSGPANGKSLGRIDQRTGAILERYFIGQDPTRVVATTSGDYLYIAFAGENRIRRFNLLTNLVDLDFSVGGEDSFDGPYYAEDLLPVRGSDDLLAVTRRSYYSYPRGKGTVVFDQGRQLPDSNTGSTSSNILAYTDLDNTLLGYNNEDDYLLRKLDLSENGLTVTGQYAGLYTSAGVLEYAAGMLYGSRGDLLEVRDGLPIPGNTLGMDGLDVNAGTAVEPVPADGKLYYFGRSNNSGRLSLSIYDLPSLTFLLLLEIDPLSPVYSYSGGKSLEQLGTPAIFAYLTDDNTLGVVTLCTKAAVPPAYTGPTTICYDQSLLLAAPAGVLADGGQILWSNGEIGDSIYVNQPGEYFYRITDSNGCPGPPSPIFYVQESYYGGTLPSILEPRSDVLCEGGSLELRAEYPYGTPIVWNTGDTTSVLTVTEPGTYIAYGIEPEGGCLSPPSASREVYAIDAPVPAAPVVDQGLRIDTCTTQPINLSVSQPAVRFFWSFENTYSDQATEGSGLIRVYPNYEPVRFSVIGQDFNGCLSDPTEGLINFFYPPDPTTIQYNPTTGTLASTLPGPLLWYYQDELEGESAGRFYKPQRNGFYTARVKGPVCLSEQSNLVSVTGITTATIDDEASRRVEIFPNPTRDKLFVNFDRSLLSELTRGGVKYQLYSADGKLVSNGTVDPAVANAPISVAGLAGGVYLLTFTSNSRAVLRKRITVL